MNISNKAITALIFLFFFGLLFTYRPNKESVSEVVDLEEEIVSEKQSAPFNNTTPKSKNVNEKHSLEIKKATEDLNRFGTSGFIERKTPPEVIKNNKGDSVHLPVNQDQVVDNQSKIKEENQNLIDESVSFLNPIALNEKVREAVVNIICTSKSGGVFSPVSGSGVIVTPSGIILTNAHLGVYYLLEDYPEKSFLDCVVRTGSPAYPKFKAEIIYLPPKWVAENKKNLLMEKPLGTGEYDYAFLRIKAPVNPNNVLPTAFPFLTPEVSEVNLIPNTPIVLAAYPAGFLGGISIQKDLYLTSAFSVIGKIYTFSSSTADVVSVGGTVISQEGSSGGAVAIHNGNLIGIIVNTTLAETTDKRDLRALTLAYINRSLKEDLGVTLDEFLAFDAAESALVFKQKVAPLLIKELTDFFNQ
jgi:hypothetical protein